jgi:hypothetical protein
LQRKARIVAVAIQDAEWIENAAHRIIYALAERSMQVAEAARVFAYLGVILAIAASRASEAEFFAAAAAENATRAADHALEKQRAERNPLEYFAECEYSTPLSLHTIHIIHITLSRGCVRLHMLLCVRFMQG